MQTAIVVLLLIASLAAYVYLAISDGERYQDVVGLVDVGQEANLPTTWSALNLLVASALLLVVAESAKRSAERDAWLWLALAGGFALLALDESAGLHENARHLPLADAVPVLGARAWLTYAIPLCIALAALFLPLVASLQRDTRRRFVIAGSLFVGGAIGGEAIGAAMIHFGLASSTDFAYALRRLGEEGAEMFAVVLFNVALLQELARRETGATLAFGGGGNRPTASDSYE